MTHATVDVRRFISAALLARLSLYPTENLIVGEK